MTDSQTASVLARLVEKQAATDRIIKAAQGQKQKRNAQR